MKFVALVSGGKDSAFAAQSATHHGHQLVCMANLYPADLVIDDVDSWMYQTIGHEVIPLYAQCIPVPLYRRAIHGSSRTTALQYTPTAGDEVDDLAILLKHCLVRHPDLQAVCCGAIASDYQRTRVEYVCSQLRLTSLAPLWRIPQSILLDRMIAAGMDMMLIKTATMGLEPRRHCGRRIDEAMRSHLWRLRATYGANLCGEGGEYESLVLNAPLLTTGRLVVEEGEVVEKGGGVGGVGVYRIKRVRVEKKVNDGVTAVVVEEALDAVDAVDAVDASPPTPIPPSPTSIDPTLSCQISSSPLSSTHPSFFTIRVTKSSTSPPTTSTETASALATALAALESHLGVPPTPLAALVTVYIADMAHFATMNSTYSSLFPQISPASRACVAAPLPQGTVLLLDLLLTPATLPRHVLHVQSISSWAPSCIGPYSQANVLHGLVFLAGQIPLDPASMTIVTESTWPIRDEPWRQLSRSWLSCHRVSSALGACCLHGLVALTIFHVLEPAVVRDLALTRLSECWNDLASIEALDTDRRREPLPVKGGEEEEHEEEEEADFLGRQRQSGALLPAKRDASWDDEFMYAASSSSNSHDATHRDGCIIMSETRPVVLWVGMAALPRNSLVELQPILMQQAIQRTQQCHLTSTTSHVHGMHVICEVRGNATMRLVISGDMDASQFESILRRFESMHSYSSTECIALKLYDASTLHESMALPGRSVGWVPVSSVAMSLSEEGGGCVEVEAVMEAIYCKLP